jgi:hypothetical protein
MNSGNALRTSPYSFAASSQPANTLIAQSKLVIELLLEHTAHSCNETKNRRQPTSQDPATIFGLCRGSAEHLIAAQ